MSNRLLRFLYGVLLSVSMATLPSAALHADCACGGGELELVFVLDLSGSMNFMLQTLQEQAVRCLEALQGQVSRVRAGAVVYRTKEYNGKHKKLEVFPFTEDSKAVARFLRDQVPEGGGEEIIDTALEAALHEMQWTKGTRKLVMLIGDEQGSESMQANCRALAEKFRDRGIALNTVTGSKTAWIYYVAPGDWKQKLAGMSDEAKRSFKLPYYVELAEATGGVAVSSWDAKELVLWLLAFGLGMKEQEAKEKINVDQYLEWAKQREIEDAEHAQARSKAGTAIFAQPLIGWLKHGGEWQVPHRFEGLFEHLGAGLALAGPPRFEILGLTDENLERYPVLYVTGHGALKWNRAERDALKSHLVRGGTLIADACCGEVIFGTSLREVLGEICPGRKLDMLDPLHPLFACGHRVEKVRRCEKAKSRELQEKRPELYAMTLPVSGVAEQGLERERIAVLFSPHDLGCAWRARPLGVPCQHHDEDGIKLSANVFLWALTR